MIQKPVVTLLAYIYYAIFKYCIYTANIVQIYIISALWGAQIPNQGKIIDALTEYLKIRDAESLAINKQHLIPQDTASSKTHEAINSIKDGVCYGLSSLLGLAIYAHNNKTNGTNKIELDNLSYLKIFLNKLVNWHQLGSNPSKISWHHIDAPNDLLKASEIEIFLNVIILLQKSPKTILNFLCKYEDYTRTREIKDNGLQEKAKTLDKELNELKKKQIVCQPKESEKELNDITHKLLCTIHLTTENNYLLINLLKSDRALEQQSFFFASIDKEDKKPITVFLSEYTNRKMQDLEEILTKVIKTNTITRLSIHQENKGHATLLFIDEKSDINFYDPSYGVITAKNIKELSIKLFNQYAKAFGNSVEYQNFSINCQVSVYTLDEGAANQYIKEFEELKSPLMSKDFKGWLSNLETKYFNNLLLHDKDWLNDYEEYYPDDLFSIIQSKCLPPEEPSS